MNIKINKRRIGSGCLTYIIAEMSANHNKDFNQAVKIIEAAKESGADAIKLQTYTPDTLTIDCDNEYFRIDKGIIWEGKSLYELYREAYTSLDWQPKLKKIADELNIDLFSTPFDHSAVDFLEEIGISAYKIASFEIVDLPLIRRIARTGKPIIMSTGMASLGEIEEAIDTAHSAQADQIALLKCTSAYPADPEDMNLRTIPHLSEAFKVPVGISDHTLGITVPIAAVALGAKIVEKHLTLSRTKPGPDSSFSLEPEEFKAMVNAIRDAEKALGEISYKKTERENVCRVFRRSLFVVKDIQAGEQFTDDNVRSIRPGYGLHTRYFDMINGRKAVRDIQKGTPLYWNLVC
jgi:pseudaminic acid synthase